MSTYRCGTYFIIDDVGSIIGIVGCKIASVDYRADVVGCSAFYIFLHDGIGHTCLCKNYFIKKGLFSPEVRGIDSPSCH